MCRVRRAQAEIDDVRSGGGRPFDSLGQRFRVRREVAVKELDGDQPRIGCLLVNRRGDRGPVTDAVDRVVALRCE